MYASYRSKSTAYYECTRRKNEGSTCCGLEAGVVDDLVAQQVLRALEPATLELSLKAIQDVHKERDRLHRNWKHRLERATYEAERAERQYQAVEPENRLVARSLERQWEEALRNRRDLAEEYDRFLKEQPPRRSEDQRARILGLSSDLPTLWTAPETTAADRKEIIRLVVQHVEVHVRAETECGEVVISWRGGVMTRHEIVRPVACYESLGSYDQSMNRIIEMRQEGRTVKQIAVQLNAEGYHTPRSRKGYTSTAVRKLLSRGELTRGRIGTRQLGRHEWWLPELARSLQMSANKLRYWRCAAGFARGRFRRGAYGSSGPMGWNDSGCGSSGQHRNGARVWNQHRLAGRSSRDYSRSHRPALRGSMGSRLCDKGGIMPRRSGSVGAPGSNLWSDPARRLDPTPPARPAGYGRRPISRPERTRARSTARW